MPIRCGDKNKQITDDILPMKLATNKAIQRALSNLGMNDAFHLLQTDAWIIQPHNLKRFIIDNLSILHNKCDNNNISRLPINSIISHKDIRIIKHKIGEGKTASVHYGLYNNLLPVAVKELKGKLSPKRINEFNHEIEILDHLKHPNIAQSLGIIKDNKSDHTSTLLIMEWVNGGCLYDVLHKNKNKNKNKHKLPINYIDKLLMALDIAEGMKYIHSQNIMHRDLKTHNLLLDKNGRIKITDFGEATFKSNAFDEVGTYCYMAPEIIDPIDFNNGYNNKVDIYSFGIVLWEIYTLRSPIFEKEIKCSNDCPKDLSFLINYCLNKNPNKRPTFHLIVDYLQNIISNT